MKDERNLRHSASARLRRARRIADEALPILAKRADEITDADMANLRNQATDFGQAVHEFNAYRNALEWNDTERGR